MDIKLAKRRSYARRLIESQIEATLKQLDCFEEEKFLLLVNRFRNESGLLDYCPQGGHARFHSTESVLRGLNELFNSRRYWIRDQFDWQPDNNDVTFYSLFGSLARHLLATHEVPRFLDSAWWSQGAEAKQHRMWFRHIGQGNSMLGLRVAGLKSRPVVRRFLQAPSHYSVPDAIAWAQKRAEPPAPVPIYPAGLSRRRRRRLHGRKSAVLWHRIGVNDFHLTEYRFGILNIWRIRQIRRSELLREEGATMKHCVATYEPQCRSGSTTIWSMTRKIFDGKDRKSDRTLTIEVTPRRVILQALGFRNRRAKKVEREIMLKWAEKENLSLYKWL